jgi:hypothetical protein
MNMSLNFEPQFDLFLNNLKVYYDLSNKCLMIGVTGNKNNQGLIFRKSFIFSNSFGNFKILNSVSDIIQSIQSENLCELSISNPNDLYMKEFIKLFKSFCESCNDYSNIFIKFYFEFVECLKNKKLRNAIGKEIKYYYFDIYNYLTEFISTKV